MSLQRLAFVVCRGYKDVPDLYAACSNFTTRDSCFTGGNAVQSRNLTVSCIWREPGTTSIDITAIVTLRGNSLLYGGFDYSGSLCAIDTKITLDPKANNSWSTYMHLYGKKRLR